MDARSRKSLRWVLTIGGVFGVLGAADILLVTLAEYGNSHAAFSVENRLPLWALLRATPPDELTMLIVGFLCALLLVAGRWPIKVCAALAAAWFVYAQGAFGSGSHWAEQVSQTFDTTPFYVAALVGVAALLAVSVLALVMAARQRGLAESLPGDAAQPPLS